MQREITFVMEKLCHRKLSGTQTRFGRNRVNSEEKTIAEILVWHFRGKERRT